MNRPSKRRAAIKRNIQGRQRPYRPEPLGMAPAGKPPKRKYLRG